MGRPSKYPDELMARGIRLALESDRPIAHIARDLGIGPEALRKRVRRAEVDAGLREGLTSEEREEIKRLRAEVFELRRANSILREASVFFAKELDPDLPKCLHRHASRALRGRADLPEVARRPTSPDREYYEQAADRLGGNRACLSIARKLLKRSYHTLRELGEEALQPA
jgi:transposase